MNTENARLLETRRALFGCFLVLGFVMASWIVRTPSIRDALSASTAEMGLILFGFSLGSMGGILLASNIVARIGADRAVCAGMTLALAGLVVLSSGTHLALAWKTGLGLALVGFGMAQAEVAVNVLGVHVERGLKRPVLTLVHGCFSLGTTLGAVCGLLLVSQGLSVTSHMLGVCALLSPMLVYVTYGVVGSYGARVTDSGNKRGFLATIKGDPKLILIGSIVLAVALAEGAANDWLPLLIVDAYETSEAIGSLLFVAFAATMTLGRFLGTGALSHFGPVNVIRASALIGAAGILIVVLTPTLYVAGVGVFLWGIGASLGFPVAMSAGASVGYDPSARIAILATIGYMAFLVGPPLLGFIGEHIGLRLTMLVVLALLALPLLLASTLQRRNA